MPNVYEIRADKIDYKTLKGLVISGNDKKLNPINSKQITNTFLRLGANIQTTELKKAMLLMLTLFHLMI